MIHVCVGVRTVRCTHTHMRALSALRITTQCTTRHTTPPHFPLYAKLHKLTSPCIPYYTHGSLRTHSHRTTPHYTTTPHCHHAKLHPQTLFLAHYVAEWDFINTLLPQTLTNLSASLTVGRPPEMHPWMTICVPMEPSLRLRVAYHFADRLRLQAIMPKAQVCGGVQYVG